MFRFEGRFLYRAVTKREWNELLNSGWLSIAEGTKFEKDIGPQVKYHLHHKDYAGIVIKMDCKGLYFLHNGVRDPQAISLQLQRVLADNIEISETGETGSWKPISKKRNSQKRKNNRK
ncbi:MAG: hypothetical protein ISS43_04985 [Candidatus Omnitrophica bacterium]|nr:hypothetical protein [Candidatus Omnitrophota bacterium]